MEDTTTVTMVEEPEALFSGLTFVIIPTAISTEEQQQLTQDIVENGGTLHPFDDGNGRIRDLRTITHIISTTSDFPDYQSALELFKHVIKPSWVQACASTKKIRNPRTYSPDPALFMTDVVICCGSSIPQGDREAIQGGVLAMGGQFTAALTKTTTHLIALDLEDDRCGLALNKRLRIIMLLPHWFDDCLRLGRRISERPYILPDPEILNAEAGAIPSIKAIPHVRDAADPEPADPRPPRPAEHSESTRHIQAFKGKKIMLGEDLSLSRHLKDAITETIEARGGRMTNTVEEADMYVCNYREGVEYTKASQADKDVGNLSWLYHMITHGAWTSPLRRLLHYPRPRGGIPGFEKHKISISSYTGDARVYLENLIIACGAHFTKTFRQDNTHLITAHKQSEKCEAAEEWAVHIVNHLWLEESYARCREQSLTNRKYVYFPPRTNLGEILGQTEIDRAAVASHFFAKTTKQSRTKSDQDKDTHSTPAASKVARTKSAPAVSTPAVSRHANPDGKENETPGSTGSRSAKDKALSKLHDAASDIAKFEKEMKRKGGVVHGGCRAKDLDVPDNSKKSRDRDSVASKRSFEEVEDAGNAKEESQDSVIEIKKVKRSKKDAPAPVKFRMLISGDKRWVNNGDKESKDKSKLRELGLFVVDDPKKVDILCAPKIVRTQKFVSALASAPTVVSSSYLDYALQHSKLPPPHEHILRDSDFEDKYGFRLDEALERAEQNKKRLLKDWNIFCTQHVVGGFDTFKEIIQSNGGVCHRWEGRTTTINAAKRTIKNADAEVSQNQEEDEGDVLYLISGSTKPDMKLWPKFRELAKKHDMVPRIVSTEWILFVAMAQYVHWDPVWEMQ
ncbi:BRCT domain-containing protein [Sporormia fimetaria CBS 119925]|uniref:BRCT domain-containing protein n=1 Tax=Sporormia fimetaria CBS 119925 TaxID=1340428 RepID=A0A6A6V7D2_9PLEO|nr:BRCT domain-containing protein [Sporormia fimetaria CBS 119925]